MSPLFVSDKGKAACPIWLLGPGDLAHWRETHAGQRAAWLDSNRFTGADGEMVILPNHAGGIDGVVLGVGSKPDPFALARLPRQLPEGTYRLSDDTNPLAPLAWALGTYRFSTYLSQKTRQDWPSLVVSPTTDIARLQRMIDAVFRARDLINLPAEAMGPLALVQQVEEMAARVKGTVRTIIGDDLLSENYPMIHAVGRAAAQPPCFVEMVWGDEAAPEIVLVGKGVCFDTGGLNLKTGSYMDIMKKDMGGAAIALALAEMIATSNWPVRVRLLIGAVENAIGPGAFRPGDILPSRQGMQVEIGNTDAEGRLVLADLLSEAIAHHPDLIIDFATLTGAARIALGPEVMPFYTRDDEVAAQLMAHGAAQHDPLWRLPLWSGYESWLDSSVADISHVSSSPMAGSVTAALFLSRFVPDAHPWVHFDVYGWNIKARPGRPVGGEATALRAVYSYLESRYAQS